MNNLFVVFTAVMALNPFPLSAQEPAKTETPVGTWRGESKCLVRPSGCNDEDSLYRFSASGNAPDKLRLSGNKIVSGREVNMGDMDCRYNAKGQKIDCPLRNGASMHFELSGNTINGTMTLGDGTAWRKISLHKVGEKSQQ